MRNIVKRIVGIFLIITLVVSTLQEFCYAGGESEGGSDTGATHIYPNYGLGMSFRVKIYDADGSVLMVKEIMPIYMQGQTTLHMQASSPNNMYQWGEREFDLGSVVFDAPDAGGDFIYVENLPYIFGAGAGDTSQQASQFIEEAKAPFVIQVQEFKDWAVQSNAFTDKFMGLMSEIGASSVTGGADFMTWFKTDKPITGGVGRPFVTIEPTAFMLQKSAYSWTTRDDGKKEVSFNSSEWHLCSYFDYASQPDLYEASVAILQGNVQINESSVTSTDIRKALPLMQRIVKVGTKYLGVGIVSGYSDGSSGGGGSTPTPPPSNEKPNTGTSANMELYDDEISYYYSMTNVNLGTNRELTYIINEGGNPHGTFDLCDCGSQTCSSKTSGEFTVTVSHTTQGDTCIIVGAQDGDGVVSFSAQELATGKVALPDGGKVNQWVTGFRDKAIDLRTMWAGSTYAPVDSGVEQQLQKYGIGKGYAPTGSSYKTGRGSYTTTLNITYDCKIEGQTEQCDKEGHDHHHCDC